MKKTKLIEYLNGFSKHDSGASGQLIEDLNKRIDFKLPDEYLSFIKENNGGEGEIGNSWLCLFPIEELLSVNKNYRLLLEQIPEYFLFGKDAADTGYIFHKTKHTFHAIGLMSDFNKDPIEYCGQDFLEFLEYLYFN